jgi:Uma2 family endonuclease
MIQAGVFARDNRFELLEGWIVPKMSRNPPHDASMELARGEVSHRLPQGWHVRQQSAITLEDSEPEPDLALVEGTARRYSARHPEPADIQLIIEVADSSLMEDKRRKMRLYARAGIHEYWIINLVASQVEVHTDPTGPSGVPEYHARREFKIDESVPLIIGGQVLAPIPVKDLLP